MTKVPIKGIVYDLDGTLVNSAPDIAASVNAALALRGLPSLPVAIVETLIGTGSRNICRLSIEELGHAYDDAYLDAMVADFFAAYRRAPIANTVVYPGVTQVLEDFAAMGLVQGLCTNKSTEMSKIVIASLGLAHLFDVNIGADLVSECKPHPGHLKDVVNEMRCSFDEIVFVGDTMVDLQCAKAAGVRFFIVGWGREQAKNDGYGTVVDSFAQLKELVTSD